MLLSLGNGCRRRAFVTSLEIVAAGAGPLCEVCEDGYIMQDTYCVDCKADTGFTVRLTSTGQVIVALLSAAVAAFLIVSVRKYYRWQRVEVRKAAHSPSSPLAGQAGSRVLVAAIVKFMDRLSTRLKAIIGFFQLYSVVVNNYGKFPSVVKTVSEGLQFANLVG